MSDIITISVIIPVFEVKPEVLLRAVRSVPIFNPGPDALHRTVQGVPDHPETEIIVVFDGCVERYESSIGSILRDDPRVRLIAIPHGGVSRARNAGVSEARGRWVLFLDADDYLMPGALENLLNSAADGIDMVLGGYEARYPDGSVRSVSPVRVSGGSGYGSACISLSEGMERASFIREVLNPQTGLGFCWAKLYRRELLVNEGICFDENLEAAEDAVFVLRCALEASGVALIPEKVYVYEIRTDSAVRAYREDYPERYEKAFRAVKRLLTVSRLCDAGGGERDAYGGKEATVSGVGEQGSFAGEGTHVSGVREQGSFAGEGTHVSGVREQGSFTGESACVSGGKAWTSDEWGILRRAYETFVLYHLLLITVNYSFHPGNGKSGSQQMRDYRRLIRKPLYRKALRYGNADGFALSRRITVRLIRHGCLHLVRAAAWVRQRQLGA